MSALVGDEILWVVPLAPNRITQSPIQEQTTTGAIAALATSPSFSGFANVLFYGADPTGVSHSDAAFALAIATGLSLIIPPGTYKFVAPIVTGGTQQINVFGGGRGQTQLIQTTTGADLWQHGLITAATGCFRIRDLDIVCVGLGGTGLNMSWGSTTDLNLFVLQDIEFRGQSLNVDAWNTPFQTQNYPFAPSWLRVNAFGANSGSTPQSTNCFTFTSTRGSFGFTFIDCNVSGYNYAWDFVFSQGYGNHGHEGVYMLRCNAYNGMGLMSALNDVGNYWSPNWILEAAGYQGAGTAIAASNLTQLNVSSGIFYTNPDLGASPRYLVSMNNCQNCVIRDNFIGIPPASGGGSTDVMFYVFGSDTYGVVFDSNNIYNTGTFASIYEFASGIIVNMVAERQTFVVETGTWAVGQVNDAGGNQVSELALAITSLNGTGGVVGNIPYGLMLLRGLYVGTTDSNGKLNVPYPVRPVTGDSFFKTEDPVTVFTNVNYTVGFFDVEPAPRIYAQSSTGFTALFPGASGIQVSISWLSFGA